MTESLGGGAGFRGNPSLSFTIESQTSGVITAGTHWKIDVPVNEFWQIIYIKAIFTTDATVATRYPVLVITSKQQTTATRIPANGFIGASLSGTYAWLIDYPRMLPDNTDGTAIVVNGSNYRWSPLPGLAAVVDGGEYIEMHAENLKAGDQFSQGTIIYRKFKASSKKLTLL